MGSLRVSGDKIERLKTVIKDLGRSPFDAPAVERAGEGLSSLAEAGHYAFCFFPGTKRSRPIVISNNPPCFLPVYFSVMGKDFLVERLLGSGAEYVSRRSREYADEENRDFMRAVQSARPVSDMAYFPLKAGGIMRGYCAFGKEGLHRSPFSDDELEILRFGLFFLNEAYERSLRPAEAAAPPGVARPLGLGIDPNYELSPRELEVLRGILAGKTNKAIALELGIEEGTVKRHSHGIFEKTGFRSRVELALGLPVGFASTKV